MRAASAALVLSALAALGGSARIKSHASHLDASDVKLMSHANLSHGSDSKLGWLIKTEKYCTGKAATLFCDDSSIIKVKRSAYNRNKPAQEDEAKACQPVEGPEKGCEVFKDAEKVIGKCNGQRTCVLEPTEHVWCDKDPFWTLRVVFECVTGSPPTAVEDIKETDNQEDPEETAVVPEKKKKDRIKQAVDKLVNDPDAEAEAELKPCYRYTRTYLLKNFRFLDPLTSCSKHEGCFKVTFPDATVFRDPKTPPTAQELVKADYSPGIDSYWLTFNPVGLQRNEYDTWGVCLPKGEGIDFAIETFDRLKAR